LIESFIADNTEDKLEAIRKEIEKSNEFGVYIIPEWKPGDGERMYGAPMGNYFHIDYTGTCYPFDTWDIDEDIKRSKIYVEAYETYLKELLNNRTEICNKCGAEAIAVMDEIKKNNGKILPNNLVMCKKYLDESDY
jgi:hypothetical protein